MQNKSKAQFLRRAITVPYQLWTDKQKVGGSGASCNSFYLNPCSVKSVG